MIKVELLEYTPNPDKVVATAAKLCYSSKSVSELVESVTEDENKTAAFVERLMSYGHMSPFEHLSFTFGIEGISRTLTHQLVRHRIASYSQKSQRYVNEKEFEYITPPSIQANDEALGCYEAVMKMLNNAYGKLVDLGIPKEDARYVLPNACETKIIVTMNARSLFNFFNHRCCMRAQWEIRQMAYQMLNLVKEVAPETFKKAGASCDTLGYCVEGSMSCGRYPTLNNILTNFKSKGENKNV